MKPSIVEEFVDTGQVRLVSRHFAFLGPESLRAAEASECAADQGAFESFSVLLYANQRGRNAGGFADPMLNAFAQVIGLDADDFATCLSSGRHRDDVERDRADADAIGVDHTPTVFVNGVEATSGLPGLRAAILEAVAATSP